MGQGGGHIYSEETGSMMLRNVRNQLQDYTVSIQIFLTNSPDP
jgi:hypothetical protein